MTDSKRVTRKTLTMALAEAEDRHDANAIFDALPTEPAAMTDSKRVTRKDIRAAIREAGQPSTAWADAIFDALPAGPTPPQHPLGVEEAIAQGQRMLAASEARHVLGLDNATMMKTVTNLSSTGALNVRLNRNIANEHKRIATAIAAEYARLTEAER